MKRTLITLAMTLSVAAPAMADMALATSKNCMACHAVDKKMVGPSYKDVAACVGQLEQQMQGRPGNRIA